MSHRSVTLEELILSDENLWKTRTDSLPELPSKFSSSSQYRECFSAILIEEARESVKSAFRNASASGLKVKVELKRVAEGDNLSVVFFVTTPKPSLPDALAPNTIVAVSLDPMQGFGDSTPKRPYAFGVVLQCTPVPAGYNVTVKVVFKNDANLFHGERSTSRFSAVVSNHGAVYWLLPSTKLSTFSQELSSLDSLDKMDQRLLHFIMDPSSSSHVKGEPTFAHKFPSLTQLFNTDQMYAIQRAILNDARGPTYTPITLIQGPPGTGKTHTIWGLLNVLHLMKFEDYYQSLVRIIRGFEEKRLTRPHILVCAPSNGAVVNILHRVANFGFIQRDGNKYWPSIIQVGASSMNDSNSPAEFSVEKMADTLLRMSKEDWLLWFSRQYHTVKAIEQDLNLHLNLLQHNSDGEVRPCREATVSNILSMHENRDRAVADLSRLEHLRGYHNGAVVDDDSLAELRSRIEASFVDEAEIVFTTLASSGKKCLMGISHGFQTLIVDEAAQATESCALLPLRHGVKHCILVGDPQQLPSTILSKLALNSCYDKSLFERLVDNRVYPTLLSVQYRMHSSIRQFPSNFFYGGKLVDGETYDGRESAMDYSSMMYSDFVPFGPYLVFDTSAGTEKRNENGSVKNEFEASLCVRLLQVLEASLHKHGISRQTVALISPYTCQCARLQQLTQHLQLFNVTLTISTIDGFQGRESDIVIFSCVRNSATGMGFMNDARRLNVALTRAKKTMWILCSANADKNQLWASLLRDARNRNVLVPQNAVHAFATQIHAI